MKRHLMITGLALCFSLVPAFGQRHGGSHGGGMHGPGMGIGGPGSGISGMHGSWGDMSRGNGVRTVGAGRAASTPDRMSHLSTQGTPAATVGGVSPWRRIARAMGFGRSTPMGTRTKGTVDVPETIQQAKPHNVNSTR